MNLVIVEPYATSSHLAWAQGIEAYSKHDVSIFSLPGRFWKWRMHGGAITLASMINAHQSPIDVILASEMMDLSLFKSLLAPDKQKLPIVLYFHENQLTYPWSEEDSDILMKRDNHYGFINYTAALVADKVVFNSNFHREEFLNAAADMLHKFPDFQNEDTLEIISHKSNVLQPGLELSLFKNEKDVTLNKVPTVVWNHRWEYDKNPDLFFNTLIDLNAEGVQFKLIVLGKEQKGCPPIFATAKKALSANILHWGYAKSKAEYAQWLKRADILPVTSHHDFFGISILEAIYAGATPLLPFRLVYPEHLDHPELFYTEDGQFKEKLRERLLVPKAKLDHTRLRIEKYDWKTIISQYDSFFEQVLNNS